MKTNIKIIGVAILILTSSFCFSQTSNKKKFDKSYTKSRISSDMKIKKGDTKQKDLHLREGYAYFISVDGKNKREDIHYRIKSNGQTIYDNSLFEYSQTSNITCHNDEVITLEILSDPDCYQRKGVKSRNVNFTFAYKKIKNYEKPLNNTIPAYVSN